MGGTSASARRPPLPALTGLRFFAAAEVVVFHGYLPWQSDFLRGVTAAGYEAVTFFFVLSGFILTYVYAGASERDGINVTPQTFWKARAARIVPAYYLGLLLLLPMLVYSAFISKIMAVKWLVLALATVPTFLQAWWPPAANLWNAPAWSLSVEFFFYALFPALTIMAIRMSPRRLFILAYCAVLAMTAFRFAVLSPDSPPESFAWNFERFFPPWHLPQFIFGIALGRLFLFGPAISAKLHRAMFWAGVAGLIFVFGERSLLPWWAQTDAVLAPLFGLVIFGAARMDRGALSSPTLILLGEASYSMYILHMPVQFWWGWFLQKVVHQNPPVFVNFALYFALVIVVSVLTYLFIERPARRWLLDRRRLRTAPAAA